MQLSENITYSFLKACSSVCWLSLCSVRYHMFGEEVWRLTVTAQEGSSGTVLFQKEGNYGDSWNYAQATLTIAAEAVVSSWTNRLKLHNVKRLWSHQKAVGFVFRWCSKRRRGRDFGTTSPWMTSASCLVLVAWPLRSRPRSLLPPLLLPFQVRDYTCCSHSYSTFIKGVVFM